MTLEQQVAELNRKLALAHGELERRRRRDVEIAAYIPTIAARLQVIAEDIKCDQAVNDEAWWQDPDIDWAGIER